MTIRQGTNQGIQIRAVRIEAATASRPAAGRVTSQAKAIPCKDDRSMCRFFFPAPALAPAATWVVEKGSPKYAPAETSAAVAM